MAGRKREPLAEAEPSAAPAPDETPRVEAAPEPAPKRRASQPGYTLCRVTGSNVSANGRWYAPGDEGEFLAVDIRSLPEFLIPIG